MSNQIVSFNYEHQEIRVIKDEKGEPWWVAKDVCDVLEVVDVSNAVKRLDEDEKGTHSIRTLGGEQNMLTVNEPGLYTLIFCSKKPDAKEFRRWITHEVIPSIRKTGSYSTKPELTTMIPLLKELKAASELAKLSGLQGNQAILAANEITLAVTGHDCFSILGHDCFSILGMEKPVDKPKNFPLIDKVLNWAKKHNKNNFSVREILSSKFCKNAKEANDLLQTMQTSKYGTIEKTISSHGGRQIVNFTLARE